MKIDIWKDDGECHLCGMLAGVESHTWINLNHSGEQIILCKRCIKVLYLLSENNVVSELDK